MGTRNNFSRKYLIETQLNRNGYFELLRSTKASMSQVLVVVFYFCNVGCFVQKKYQTYFKSNLATPALHHVRDISLKLTLEKESCHKKIFLKIKISIISHNRDIMRTTG